MEKPIVVTETFRTIEASDYERYLDLVNDDYIKYLLNEHGEAFTVERDKDGKHRITCNDRLVIEWERMVPYLFRNLIDDEELQAAAKDNVNLKKLLFEQLKKTYRKNLQPSYLWFDVEQGLKWRGSHVMRAAKDILRQNPDYMKKLQPTTSNPPNDKQLQKILKKIETQLNKAYAKIFKRKKSRGKVNKLDNEVTAVLLGTRRSIKVEGRYKEESPLPQPPSHFKPPAKWRTKRKQKTIVGSLHRIEVARGIIDGDEELEALLDGIGNELMMTLYKERGGFKNTWKARERSRLRRQSKNPDFGPLPDKLMAPSQN